MSKSFDDRIVSMQFDNRQFESNVQTSLGTIQKLKSSLKFENASKGLEGITSAAKKCDLTPLGDSAEKIGLKFSAMYTFADQAMRDIYNSVKHYAKKIVSAFTIDPVKSGFQEYETQINAVQTILANTQSKGTTLEDVTRALDELNTYADKTIYNFTEMTRNIGTFTAAGVELDTATSAIQGIANLAAISGSNSQQASTAMYQLSQAMASGRVMLQDWNSVTNAGMGGQVFQDSLIETARVHGIEIDKMIEKQGSFRNTLTEGWLTTDILTETLEKFTMAASDMTDAEVAQARAMYKSLGYTEEQIDGIFQLGQTANDAATKVKTFTQLMDTLKESAQSGWTQSWEIIFGDFEEAKAMWTAVSDELGGIIGASAEKRNKFLEEVFGKSNYDRFIDKVEDLGISSELFNSKLNTALEDHGYNVADLIKEYGSLEKAFQKGAVSGDILDEALRSVGKTTADLSKVNRELKFGDKGEDVKQIQQWLTDLGVDIGEEGVDGIIGKNTEAAIKAFQKANNLDVTGVIDTKTLDAMNKSMSSLAAGTSLASGMLRGLIDDIDKLGGRELLLDSIANIWKGLKSIFSPIKEAFDETFSLSPETVYGWIDSFHKLTEGFGLTEERGAKLKEAFKGIFSIFKGIGKVVGGALKLGFKAFGKILGFVGNAATYLVTKFGELINNAKDLYEKLMASPKVKASIDKLKTGFSNFGETLKTKFAQGVENLKTFLASLKDMDFSIEGIKSALKGFYERVIKPFFTNEDGSSIFSGFGEAIVNLWKTVKDYLSDLGVDIGNFGVRIAKFFTGIKNLISGNIGGIAAFASLAGIFYLFKQVIDVIALFGKPLEVLEDVGDIIEGFGKSIKAFNRNLNSVAMKNMATSIAILTGCVVALSLIPSESLRPAILSLVGVMAALAGLMWVMSKVGDSPLDTAKLALSLAALSGSLMLFAVAAKVIAGVDNGGLLKTGVVLLAFVGLVKLLSVASKGMTTSLAGFAKMMLGLSASLLIMSVVTSILGHMKTETLVKGILAIGAMLGMMVGMMAATKLIAKDIPKFATMMTGLSFALLLMTASIGILGQMKTETLVKGVASIGAVLLMMVGIMAATKLLAKDMPKFGATMTGLGFGLLAMSAAIGILGSMKTSTLVKGGIAVAALLGIFVGLMAATKLLTKNSKNAAKIGLMMLSFAASITLLTASIALLSLINVGSLAKAIGAIALVGGVFAGLMYVTKFAKVGKGMKTTLVTMTATIGVLALSLVALSFIDTKKLLSSAAALGGVMAALAAMIFATKSLPTTSIGKSIGMLAAMAGMVLILGGIIYLLSDMPNASEAVGIAAGLSALVLSLSASCVMLGLVGKIGPSAFIGIAVLAALLAVIGGVVAIAIASLPAVGKQLSSFMTELTPFLDGAAKIDNSMMDGLKTLAEAILILTGASFIHAIGNIGTFGGMNRAFKSFASWLNELLPIVKSFALDLSADGVAINSANLEAVLGAVKTLCECASLAPSATMVVTPVGGFVKIPMLTKFTNWIKEVTPLVSKMALDVSAKGVNINAKNLTAITDAVTALAEAGSKAPTTKVFASLAGTYVEVPRLKTFAKWIEDVSDCVKGLAMDVSAKGVKINSKNLTAITDAALALAEAGSKAPTTKVFASLIGSYVEVPMLKEFADWIIAVSDNLKGLAIDVSGIEINTGNLIAVTEAVTTLAEAASKAPTTTVYAGLGGVYVSITELTKFAEWITEVGSNAKKLAVEVSDVVINTGNLTAVTEAVRTLAEAANAAPTTEVFSTIGAAYVSVTDLAGFAQWLTDIGARAKEFSVDVSGVSINTTNVTAVTEAVKTLAEAANKIAPIKSIVTPVGGYFEVSQLGKFTSWITEVVPTVKDMVVTVNTELKASKINTVNIKNVNAVIDAVKTLAEASKEIPTSTFVATVVGGWMTATQFSEFADWLVEVLPVVKRLAVELSEDGLEINADNVTAATDAVKALAEASQQIPKVNGFKQVFSGEVGFGAFVKFMTDVGPALGTLSTTLTDANINAELISKVSIAGKALAEMASLIPEEGGIGSWFTGDTAWDTFQTNVVSFGEAMVQMSNALTNAKIAVDPEMLTNVSKAGYTIAHMLQILNTLTASRSETQVTEDLPKYCGAIATAMSDFSTKLAGIDLGSVSTASTAIESITNVLGKLSGFDYATVDVASFKSKLDEIASAIKGFAASEVATTDLSSVTANVSSVASMLSEVNSTVTTGCDAFKTALETLGETSVSDLATAFETGSETVTTAVTGMLSSAAASVAESTALTTAFTTVVDSCKTAMDEKGPSFSSAGLACVQGFAAGISDNTFMATAKATAMAEAALAAAKEALKINSPSKVFKWVGQSVPEGFALGIESLGGMIKRSTTNMARTAIDSATRAISHVAEIVNSDVDSQPTIRPILDLSDVSTGVNAINDMFDTRPTVATIARVNAINSMMNTRQNGVNDDIVSAIKELENKLGNNSGDTFHVNGITYDDGTNVADAVGQLIRAVKVERRT